MIFAKPGGTRVTIQPVSCGVTSPEAPSSTCQSDGTTGHDGSTIARSILRIDREVGERELLDAIAALVQHARLQQQAGGVVGPESMPVAQAVLRLEHDDLHRAAADAICADDAKLVEARQRLLLLGGQRRKHVAKRARLDAHELRIGVIAAHFALAAHHFARGPVEIHELREFAAIVVQMRDPRRLDARPDLVDDRADVVELARRLRGARQPGHRVVGTGVRSDEREHKDGRDEPAGDNGGSCETRAASASRRVRTGISARSFRDGGAQRARGGDIAEVRDRRFAAHSPASIPGARAGSPAEPSTDGPAPRASCRPRRAFAMPAGVASISE